MGKRTRGIVMGTQSKVEPNSCRCRASLDLCRRALRAVLGIRRRTDHIGRLKDLAVLGAGVPLDLGQVASGLKGNEK